MAQIIGGNALININLILEKAQISASTKVADLGCGASGHFIFPAANLVGKRGKIYAVDILKTVLETVDRRIKQENLINIQTIWSDIEVFGATKVEAGSLDIAILMNTLYQSHKRVEIMREAIRMIKKNGKLIVVEWKSIASPFGPPIGERVKADLLKIAAEKLGLQLEEEFEAGQYHYGMMFVKL